MTYGLTLNEVDRRFRPDSISMPWGSCAKCTRTDKYQFWRIEIGPGHEQGLYFVENWHGVIWLERGTVVIRTCDSRGNQALRRLEHGAAYEMPAFCVQSMYSAAGAELYAVGPAGAGDELIFHYVEPPLTRTPSSLLSGPMTEAGSPLKDKREKYWGNIGTFSENDFGGKRIFLRKGCQSSMEFHLEKYESYYVHSGKVRVGLRCGRAENRSLILTAGEAFDIHPGVMHMRIALEDTVIIEASTRDSDKDSHLVEDGQKYNHVNEQDPS